MREGSASSSTSRPTWASRARAADGEGRGRRRPRDGPPIRGTAGVSRGEPGRHPSPLPVDSLSMWEATTALPEQMAAALDWRRGGRTGADGTHHQPGGGRDGRQRHRRRPGGGGGRRRDVGPVTVVQVYDLPSFCGPDTLVLSVSFSGDTAKALEAAERAAAAGASAGGGHLRRCPRGAGRAGGLAGGARTVGIPQPRAALGAMAVPALVAGRAAGAPRGGDQPSRRGRRAPRPPSRPAGRRERAPVAVARRIGRTFPLVAGRRGPGVAAIRWRTRGRRSQYPALRPRSSLTVAQRGGGLGAGRGCDPQVLTW